MESRETLCDSSQPQSDTSQTAKTDLSEPAGSSMQAEPLASSGESINPFAPDDGRYVTLEEYWARWYENPYRDIDVSYEWNNGRLEAKPSHNAPQLALCNWFLQLLLRYISTYPIAKLINLETGFVLTIEDPSEPSGQRKAVRKPDIGVILTSNPVTWGGVDRRHFDGVCDLVVEAVSDATQAEVLRDTEEKRRGLCAGRGEGVLYSRPQRRAHALLPPHRWRTLRGDTARCRGHRRFGGIAGVAVSVGGYAAPAGFGKAGSG